MATKTYIVIFNGITNRNAHPEIFTCSAAEAKEMHELLRYVENGGYGSIESTYKYFVEEVQPITLAELRERFAEELEELQAADEEADEELAAAEEEA